MTADIDALLEEAADHDGRHSGTLAGRERPFTWRQMGRIPDDLWAHKDR